MHCWPWAALLSWCASMKRAFPQRLMESWRWGGGFRACGLWSHPFSHYLGGLLGLQGKILSPHHQILLHGEPLLWTLLSSWPDGMLSSLWLSGLFPLKVTILWKEGCLFVVISLVNNLRRLSRLTESEQYPKTMINMLYLHTEKIILCILIVDVNDKVHIHFCKAFIS